MHLGLGRHCTWGWVLVRVVVRLPRLLVASSVASKSLEGWELAVAGLALEHTVWVRLGLVGPAVVVAAGEQHQSAGRVDALRLRPRASLHRFFLQSTVCVCLISSCCCCWWWLRRNRTEKENVRGLSIYGLGIVEVTILPLGFSEITNVGRSSVGGCRCKSHCFGSGLASVFR